MIQLRFVGNWSPWWGLLAALLLASAAAWLYHRETRNSRGFARFLPLLRAATVACVTLMLIEPVVHHRRLIGQVARVIFFIDESPSMAITDDQAPAWQKLQIAEQLGWIEGSKAQGPSWKISREIATATQHIMMLESAENASANIPAPANANSKSITNAPLTPASGDAVSLVQSLEKNLDALQPLIEPDDQQSLADLKFQVDTFAQNPPADSTAKHAALTKISANAQLLVKKLQAAQERYAEHLSHSNDPTIASVLRRFDQSTRWQRVCALLAQSSHSLAARLVPDFDLMVVGLRDDKPRMLWSSSHNNSTSLADALPDQPTGHQTNLSAALEELIKSPVEVRSIAVLVSDGRHNQGPWPLQAAKILGTRGIPVFTVGIGQVEPLRDVAVASVQGPESLSMEDRLRGRVVIHDHLPIGTPMKLLAQWDEQTIWSQNIAADNSGQRSIAFEIPMKEAIESHRDKTSAGNQQAAIPMFLNFRIEPVEGEKSTQNNAAPFECRVSLRKRRLLLIDAQPRWEFRYLRNLLERDPRWDVTAIDLSASAAQQGGSSPIPLDRDKILSYDLVILGDVSRGALPGTFPTMLKDLVATGGGLILIGGQRQQLRTLCDSELGQVIPVKWGEPQMVLPQTSLQLTDSGKQADFLHLLPDPTQNQELWNKLPPPRWTANLQPVATAQVLLSTGREGIKDDTSDEHRPLLVWRRYGSGKVVVAGFDETWRWRYRVADLYHQRYWNQLAQWSMDQPYALQGPRLSLDVQGVVFEPGQQAPLRMRLLDEQGRPDTQSPPPQIKLFRDDQLVSTVAVSADPIRPGVYVGTTSALTAGRYRVSVPSSAMASNASATSRAELEFLVREPTSGELVELNCDAAALRAIAEQSNAKYLGEENAATLPQLLEPLRKGKIVETETSLSQSWWWLVPIVLLLTSEWLVRRRYGML